MSTRRPVLLLLATLAAGPALLTARTTAQTATPDFSAIVARLEAAALAGDATALKDARLACLRLLASPAPADRAALIRYTVAYAGWRMAFMPAVSAKEQADLVEDAKTQLEAITSADGRNAEALGLLSAVYGAQIAKNPDLGMTLGMASGEVLGRAMGIDPANPRLHVLQAQSLFHTPPEYGGSVRNAEAALRRALQLFDQEPPTKPWPNWGRFDAHAWLGQALADRRENAGARAEYEQALKIAPDSAWVKYTLLPAVK
jgi:tetratricopeptide (TPR) repeat protein